MRTSKRAAGTAMTNRSMTTRSVMSRSMMGAVALAGLAWPALGQHEAGEPTGVSLTIYSLAEPGGVPVDAYRPVPGQAQQYYGWTPPGYAVVREQRELELPKDGRQSVRVTGVAALIDPTTVLFQTLDGSGSPSDMAAVLSQSFRFDLVDRVALMRRFVGQPVIVTTGEGAGQARYEGTLLSADTPIVQSDDGAVHLLSGFDAISFPSLPEGLVTRPTLEWDLSVKTAGATTAQVSYETKGITWWADYNVVWKPARQDSQSGELDVGSWVSILNQSGATYADAKLKLIAGDVNRTQPPPMVFGGVGRYAAAPPMDMAEKGFEEKSFFEYHLYTLGRPATIPDKSTQQIELFPTARGVNASKDLVFSAGQFWGYGGLQTDRNFGTGQPGKAAVYLTFKNERSNELGVPLPKGRVRVFQQDPADGSLEFIGEDTLDHTPKDETVRLTLGEAFDVAGERTQVDFQVDAGRKTMTETIRINVRNRKDEPVTLKVADFMSRWSGWTITANSDGYQKVDASTIHFPVTLQAGEEKVIEYTVRYEW